MTRPIQKEWTFRRRFFGAVLGALFRRDRGLPLLRPGEIERVLLIRYDRLGDAIITTPVIEVLQNLNDRIRIDVLASPHNQAILEADPRINRVIVWNGSPLSLISAVLKARKEDYDLVLQLILGKTTNPTIIAGLCSSGGRIVGRGNSYNRRMFDHFVRQPTDMHFADQTFDVLLEAIDFGQEPAMPDYSIVVPDNIRLETSALLRSAGLEKKGFILLNGSAGESHRAYGAEKGSELARGLVRIAEKRGYRVGISGSPTDRELIETIADTSGVIEIRFPSILHLCAGIEEAALLVTPDTGPVHIASALGTPVVAYYSEHDKPEGWSPRGVPSRIVVSSVHGNVDSVSIEETLQSVEELLAELNSGVGTGSSGGR